MRVADVMTRDVISIHQADPYKEAVTRMLDAGVSGLPVLDTDGTLVGMVTEADLIAKEAYGSEEHRTLALIADVLTGRDTAWIKKAAASTVDDVMSRHVVSASTTDHLRDAARRMLETGVKRLPVTDEAGRLVGIVSRRDLLTVFRGSDDSLRREVEATLRDPAQAPEVTELACFTWDGQVLLEGAVANASDVAIVGNIVRHIPGVVKVHNNLVAEWNDQPPLAEEVRP